MESFSRPLPRRLTAAAFAPVLLVFLAAAGCRGDSFSGYRNIDPAVGYVGDAKCASCHPQQAASFPGTAMGRSFSDAATLLRDGRLAIPEGGVSFLHEKSRSRYRIDVMEGRMVQTEIRLDDLGNEVFTDARTVDYVLGSGDRGATFLMLRGNRLYEAPVAFRPRRDGWGMAAGYDQADQLRFTRPVTGPCLFCHTNRASYVEGTLNEYDEPLFDGMAIGCERCHGPGALHADERSREQPLDPGLDTSIVNPKRLPAALRDSVCFQCHLQGTVRVRKAGAPLYGFRPGLPLSDFFAVFHDRSASAGGASSQPGSSLEVVSHVERLRLSRCWKASDGRIHCLTCHDPHRTPHGEEAAAQYRAACLTCHRMEDLSRVGEPDSGPHSGLAPLDCAGCHMSKLPPTDAPHTLFTDHLIARRPPVIEKETGGHPGSEITLVNFLEGERGASRDLGVAYFVAAEDPYATRFYEMGRSILEPLLPALQEDGAALRVMVEHYLSSGEDLRAVPLLERLVQIAPQTSEFKVELARARRRSGDREGALAMARQAVEEDGDLAQARLTLGDIWLDAGEMERAEKEQREATRLDPSLAPAWLQLGSIHLRKEDNAAAEMFFSTALILDPSLIRARLGKAQALLAQADTDGAIHELQLALRDAQDSRTQGAVRVQLAKVLLAAGRSDEAAHARATGADRRPP